MLAQCTVELLIPFSFGAVCNTHNPLSVFCEMLFGLFYRSSVLLFVQESLELTLQMSLLLFCVNIVIDLCKAIASHYHISAFQHYLFPLSLAQSSCNCQGDCLV